MQHSSTFFIDPQHCEHCEEGRGSIQLYVIEKDICENRMYSALLISKWSRMLPSLHLEEAPDIPIINAFMPLRCCQRNGMLGDDSYRVCRTHGCPAEMS